MKTMLTDSHPPFDPEAERWTVGSVLLDPRCVDRIGYLEVSDFHDSTLGGIYGAVKDLRQRNQPVDLGLLKRVIPDEHWQAKIYEVVASVPVAGHVEHYARLVAKSAKHREIHQIMLLASDTSSEATVDPEALLDHVEARLGAMHVASGDGDPVTLAEASVDAAARVDAIAERGERSGVATGLLNYDLNYGGLFPGELTILASRPGVGKSSLALQVAEHSARKGRLVYLASLEMSRVELSTRLACSDSRVSNRIIRNGNLTDGDVAKLSTAFASQSAMDLEIQDRPELTVHAIARDIRQRKRRGLALAVVDYLQLIQPEDRKVPREQQVATMVRALKQLAGECDIPILCLCQLNRMGSDGIPELHHLRESGAIEQDADVVWFLSKHASDGKKDTSDHNTDWTLAKNRNGETGPLRLNFLPSRTRFEPHNQSDGFGDEAEPWHPERETQVEAF